MKGKLQEKYLYYEEKIITIVDFGQQKFLLQ